MAPNASQAVTARVEEARKLVAQARQQGNSGDAIVATATWHQAVQQWRILSESDPSGFLPELAGSLDGLAAQLTRLGDSDALEAAKQAVFVWRQAAADGFPRAGYRLASALRVLALHIGKESLRESWTLREEATNVLLRIAAEDRTVMVDAALCSFVIAERFSVTGEQEKALRYGRKTVDLYRKLVEVDIVRHGSQLERALRLLAIIQTSAVGVPDKKLIREARRVVVRRLMVQLQRAVSFTRRSER